VSRAWSVLVVVVVGVVGVVGVLGHRGSGIGHRASGDQLVRAADSVALNIAEGAARDGDVRKHHYRIALGSAAEVAAVLDLIEVDGTQATDIRRVGAMLAKLSRR